jgi:hypothetical protein
MADPPVTTSPLAENGGPVPLIEDGDTGDRFLVYESKDGVRVDLQVAGDTFWATQQQMAELFGVDRSVITKHLANIYEEGELDPDATSAKIAQVRKEGSRDVTRHIEHYNIDAAISVGYRVGSKQGTLFRRWATDKLVRFATKGFVIDAERLKMSGDHDRIAELRDIIRDIRASEANVYAELRRICALCQDYDPQANAAREFYGHMQAKLFWAIVSHTPVEILSARADANAINMGLQTWPKDEIRQADATVAKNYLSDTEIRELNRLTSILLDIFDDQLAIGKLTLMSEASALLDAQLLNLNRAVLRRGGRVSHLDAEAHARLEYKKFNDHRRPARVAERQVELARLAALKSAEKTLPKTRKSRAKP